jgi:hypothetical protein
VYAIRSSAESERTGREVVEPVLIHLREVGLLWWRIRLWFIPESLTDNLADILGAAGDDGTLVLYSNGKPVDMIMAEMTDHEDTSRGIPHHLAVQASGDPVDLEERECKVFGTEFAVPLNGNFTRFFLHRGQPGTFGFLHDRSRFPYYFTKEVFLAV